MLQETGQTGHAETLAGGYGQAKERARAANFAVTTNGYLPAVLNRKRLEAVERVASLGPDLEQVLDRLSALATFAVRVPAAAVTLVARDRQIFKGVAGLPAAWADVREMPFEYSFCKHVVGTGRPLLIEETRGHRLARANRLVTDLGVRAYAGFPVCTRDGLCIGAFSAVSFEPRDWSAYDRRLLEQLACMAALEIDHELELSSALKTALDGEHRLRQRFFLRAASSAEPTGLDRSGPADRAHEHATAVRDESAKATKPTRPVVSRSNPLLRFWLELNERRVVRVALVYLAAAWLAIDVGGEVMPALGVPLYAQTVVVITAALGFVVALATAWAFDLTPGGLMRTSAPDEPTPPA